MLKQTALALAVAFPATAENRIDQVRPDAPELAPYGNYVVGVRTETFTREDVPDVVNATPGTLPRYDREITVEIWFPAAEGTMEGATYSTFLRDGETKIGLVGRAARDANPAEGAFPLVLVSHGYPGNRFLLSPLAENLASKGYVVASIDHPDSTYSDQGAFGSTLYNRPQDQSFVLDRMAALDGPLGEAINAERVGLIGYSMGGYGALIFAGAGLDQAGVDYQNAPPDGLLSELMVGADLLGEIADERLAAVVAIGPWGRNRDFWSAEGLSNIEVPLMLMAGGVDDVSGYDAIRQIFDETTGTTRHLLTFENANHNAAAPMPAPEEAWTAQGQDSEPTFGHYADAVWDTVRMNNIAQHFVVAFMDLHLKDDAEKEAYLDLVPVASDGVWDVGEDGEQTADHTYWEGFPDRTAVGLTFETASPD